MTTNLSRNDAGYTDKSRQGILDQVNGLAWLLDNSIRIPIINYRIGLDAIVGLIPGLGDFAGLLVSSFIVIQAIRIGAPRATLLQMVLNITIEALIGLIPVLGDLFDATFKANARNVRLLNAALGNPSPNRIIPKSTGKGAIALIIGALVGLIALIGSAGVALFWGMMSLLN
jgi:hypothetical protein